LGKEKEDDNSPHEGNGLEALHRMTSALTCGGLALAHNNVHSLPLLIRTRGENRMKKLVGRDEDREITYQLP